MQMTFKHPDIFGMSGTTAWAGESADSIDDLTQQKYGMCLDQCLNWCSAALPYTRRMVSTALLNYRLPTADLLLFRQLPHQGVRTFETYHSWMWVPVVEENGTFGGLWNTSIETTKKVLAERRLATVREMGERTCEW